jgi:hypothetical protein
VAGSPGKGRVATAAGGGEKNSRHVTLPSSWDVILRSPLRQNKQPEGHPIRAGERLFTIEGEQTTTATRYSVQIGENLHIDLCGVHCTEEILDRYFWRFMNHSCEPNSLIRDRDVIALRDIQPWEAVTFDYNTTEWEMAEPFDCRCGSANCLGTIRGLKYLTLIERERLGKVAPHLSRQLAQESRIPAGISQA